jgi:hypothetical protein
MARWRTYRYRLHLTVKQTQALAKQLDYQRELLRSPRGENWRLAVGTSINQCAEYGHVEPVESTMLQCGHEGNADINAARNIFQFGSSPAG